MLKEDIKSVGIMISNKCQLDCKYCYIKNCKNNILNLDNYQLDFDNYFKKINTYLDKIIKIFPNAYRFEFWGAEPLLYMKELFDAQKYIIKNIDKKEIVFLVSSNMAYEKESIEKYLYLLHELLKEAENKKIKVNYILQISIDLPSNRHNNLRKFNNQKGSYNLVKKSFDEILSSIGIGNFNSNFFDFMITTNSVTSVTDLAPLDVNIKQIASILEEDLNNYKNILKINPDFKFNPLYFPSIANGVNYSELDGKKVYYFYKYLFEYIEKNSNIINLDKLPYYFTRDFIYWIIEYFSSSININSCGCFNSYIQVDIDGNLLPCHEFLHIDKNKKKEIILGNIFNENPISNYELINSIKNHKKELKDSFNIFKEKVFNKYDKFFRKLSNRDEYINNVSKRMFNFYMGKECIAENFNKNKDILKYDLNNILNIYLPDTLFLMEKFIKKHEIALKMSIIDR